MAKNCINPKCEKEIPSSATFCSFCGTQQVESESLSEEEKLRKELNEAIETIALLKKSLADAHAKVDNNTLSGDVDLLSKQLTIAKQKQNSLENQITAKTKEIELIKLETNKKKSNGTWIFFLLVSIVLGITSIYFYSEKESWKSDYYTASRSSNDNLDEINTLKNENSNLKEEYSKIQGTNEYLQNDIANLKAQMPKIYKTTSRAYLYKIPQGEATGSYYDSDATITIYTTSNGYGLTYHGWVSMSYLTENE